MNGEVEYTAMNDYSIDQDVFLSFLEGLRMRKGWYSGPLWLFVDNLGVHRTTKVKDFCNENEIFLIFNAPYNSAVNAVERLWAYSKQRWRTECLDIADFKNAKLLKHLVLACLESVNSSHLAKHVKRCILDMADWLTENVRGYNINHTIVKMKSSKDDVQMNENVVQANRSVFGKTSEENRNAKPCNVIGNAHDQVEVYDGEKPLTIGQGISAGGKRTSDSKNVVTFKEIVQKIKSREELFNTLSVRGKLHT